MSSSYRTGRALLSLPRAGPSRLSAPSAVLGKSSQRALSSHASTHQGICTCYSTHSSRSISSSRWSAPHAARNLQSRRTLVTSSKLRYPAAASSTANATATEKELPQLTETDKKRLRQLRNVGISAHIDRCVTHADSLQRVQQIIECTN